MANNILKGLVGLVLITGCATTHVIPKNPDFYQYQKSEKILKSGYLIQKDESIIINKVIIYK